jgi:8-oxo-dGTP diphosphatase
MARPRVAAGALFFDEDDQVMLVKPTYKEGWEIPGGYVEPGETPVEACQREILEELGLDRRLERLLVVDWAPSQTEGDKILFVFDGGLLSPQDAQRIVLPADELSTCAFHPSEVLPELLIDRLARRVTAAVRARQQGTVRYLEYGEMRLTE